MMSADNSKVNLKKMLARTKMASYKTACRLFDILK